MPGIQLSSATLEEHNSALEIRVADPDPHGSELFWESGSVLQGKAGSGSTEKSKFKSLRKMEPWGTFTMEAWRVSRPVVADSHQFYEKQDLDPFQCERSNLYSQSSL
jgi:hypothetical protein